MLSNALNRLWYGPALFGWLLAPLGWCWAAVAWLRRLAYRVGVLPSTRFPVPVIVVGNVTVGGTGKTPLTIWLVNHLREHGYRPAVVCSGYRGKARTWPQQVRPDSDPGMVGDEAVLIARETGCPVTAGRDRVASVAALLEYTDTDVVVLDDGLQHYRLARDLELVVVDGIRRHGNRLCLPVGPLREPASRAARADWTVINGVPRAGEFGMDMVPKALHRVDGHGDTRPLRSLRDEVVHAVAGIGNPARFFAQLRNLGYTVKPHPFPDHHRFSARDVTFAADAPVIMTEKDAVKCRDFAPPSWWYLTVAARPQPELAAQIIERLDALVVNKGAGVPRPEVPPMDGRAAVARTLPVNTARAPR